MRTGLGRYARIAPASGSFAPTDISGLVAWYDFSDTATITASGGAVSQVDDKSSNNYDIVQATGSFQPTTGTRSQNGLNVIDFDGGSSGFNGDKLAYGAISALTSFTAYVVAASDTTTFTQTALAGGNHKVYVRFNVYLGYINGANKAYGSAPTTKGVFGMFGTNSAQTLRFNGATSDTGTANPVGDWTAIRVGDDGSNNEGWDGWIGEIVLYDNVISNGDRTSLETYLNGKWAIY